MIKIYFSLVFTLSLFTISNNAQNIYNINDFGAIPDNKTINTTAINSAIKKCSENGGGQVLIPRGIYRTGSIQILSDINLHFEMGAVLRGSNQVQDYYVDTLKVGLIYAFEAKNISITGSGVIDGNADVFFDFSKKHDYLGFDRNVTRQKESMMPDSVTLFKDGPVLYNDRPGMLCVLMRCENVIIQNANFINSPLWTLRIADCDGVKVSGISVINNCLIPNSDGIHCTTSRNVLISNCNIVGGDDAIAITGFGDELNLSGDFVNVVPDYSIRKVGNKTGICENIIVNNCLLKSYSAGIRVGYGNNNIRNCVFSDIIIYESNRGIGIFNRDRATIENIQFENISIQTQLYTGNWWGGGEPIHISSIRQNKNIPVGKVKNVHFTNINTNGEAGVVFYGTEESILESVYLSNIRISIKKGNLNETWGGNLDLRPAYPINKQKFEFETAGIYVSYANDFDFHNVSVKWVGEPASYFTNALKIEDSKNISIKHFIGNGAFSKYQSFVNGRNNTNIVLTD